MDVIKQRIKEHEKKIASFEKDIEELNEQKMENTENASQICAPVETNRYFQGTSCNQEISLLFDTKRGQNLRIELLYILG